MRSASTDGPHRRVSPDTDAPTTFSFNRGRTLIWEGAACAASEKHDRGATPHAPGPAAISASHRIPSPNPESPIPNPQPPTPNPQPPTPNPQPPTPNP